MEWHDLVGSAGAALIVIAYGLLQTRRLDSESLAYSAMNALGSGGILLSLLLNFNLAAFIVEGFWLLISLYGLANWLHRRRERPR